MKGDAWVGIGEFSTSQNTPRHFNGSPSCQKGCHAKPHHARGLTSHTHTLYSPSTHPSKTAISSNIIFIDEKRLRISSSCPLCRRGHDSQEKICTWTASGNEVTASSGPTWNWSPGRCTYWVRRKPTTASIEMRPCLISAAERSKHIRGGC